MIINFNKNYKKKKDTHYIKRFMFINKLLRKIITAILKLFLMPLLLILLLATYNVVDCASLSEQISPQQQFENALASLTPIQLEEFNAEFGINHTNMPQRIFLAITINVIIVGAVFYGPTIIDGIYNGITEMPHTLHNIVIHVASFLLSSAQQAALNHYNAANNEEALRMLQRIIEMTNNQGTIPPTA